MDNSLIDYTHAGLGNTTYENSICTWGSSTKVVNELLKRDLDCHPNGYSPWQLMKRGHMLHSIYIDDGNMTIVGYFIGKEFRKCFLIYEIEIFVEYRNNGYCSKLLGQLQNHYSLIFKDVGDKKNRKLFKKFGKIQI